MRVCVCVCVCRSICLYPCLVILKKLKNAAIGAHVCRRDNVVVVIVKDTIEDLVLVLLMRWPSMKIHQWDQH